MKKIYTLIITLILIVLVGCSTNTNTSINSTTSNDDYKISLISPSGAPSVAIAELAVNNKENLNITTGVDATTLQSYFVNKSYDAIIAPINLGTKMYEKNKNYSLAAVLTWGNLYFASQNEFTLNDLNNKDVVFFGENTINMAVVKYILSTNNITPNITYLGSTQLTQAELLKDSNTIVLIAEPALSAAKVQKTIYSISIQTEFEKITNIKGFLQAGLFIKKDTIKEHKNVVDDFLSLVEKSANLTKTNTSLVAEYAETLELGKKAILTNAIPNCSINYVNASSCKADLEKFMAISNMTSFFGVIDNEFYYA